MTTYDAVVIGGGLAGCSAAINLAYTGRRVALFEAKAYPHHKVCGEFLSPECDPILRQLGVRDALRPAHIDSARVTVPDGMIWDAPLPGVGLGVSRYALDAALVARAQALGVTVCTESPVANISGTLDSGFTVTARSSGTPVEVTARVVIGAHGKRGTLDRTLKRAFLRRPQPFIGMKTHFRAASAPPLDGRVELHTFPGGYCGLSDIEDGRVNACLLVRHEVFARAGGSAEAFARWMMRENPHLGAWLRRAAPTDDAGGRWHTIAQIPFVPKPAVEQDVLMAGDAAGLIAPLAGNGMSMALYGGALAAAHADRFLTGELTAERLRAEYSSVWRARFAGRLRLGRLLQAGMLSPRLAAAGLRLIAALPPLGGFFVAHTREVVRSTGI